MTETHQQPGAKPSLAKTQHFAPGVVPTPAQSNRVLSLKQVAELLQAHEKTVRLMAQAGRLPGFRVGRLWRFSAARIHDWIEQTTYREAA